MNAFVRFIVVVVVLAVTTTVVWGTCMAMRIAELRTMSRPIFSGYPMPGWGGYAARYPGGGTFVPRYRSAAGRHFPATDTSGAGYYGGGYTAVPRTASEQAEFAQQAYNRGVQAEQAGELRAALGAYHTASTVYHNTPVSAQAEAALQRISQRCESPATAPSQPSARRHTNVTADASPPSERAGTLYQQGIAAEQSGELVRARYFYEAAARSHSNPRVANQAAGASERLRAATESQSQLRGAQRRHTQVE